MTGTPTASDRPTARVKSSPLFVDKLRAHEAELSALEDALRGARIRYKQTIDGVLAHAGIERAVLTDVVGPRNRPVLVFALPPEEAKTN